jgi:uncharacterized protein YbcC (UPF0753/DUF2309 family)
VEAACAQACRSSRLPLDQAIAVNPHWQRIGRPVRQVAARLAVLAGVQVFPPALLAQAWAEGRIQPADLRAALAAAGPPGRAGPSACRRCAAGGHRAAAAADRRAGRRPRAQERLSWRQAITHQVSQTCAAYFDRHQAD